MQDGVYIIHLTTQIILMGQLANLAYRNFPLAMPLSPQEGKWAPKLETTLNSG